VRTDPVELERLDASELRELAEFDVENPPEPGRRVTVYVPPKEGHRYAVGVDWALGLAGRDKDAACVIDADTEPPEQVAQLVGTWGERFDRVVYALCRYYGRSFLVGEANSVGLGRLQRIYFDYGWRWIYFENRGGDRKRRRLRSDNLGAYRSQPARLDPIISAYRRAVIDRSVVLRDEELIDQMMRLQWAPQSESIEHDDAVDSDLVMKLAGGGSPDMMISGAMGVWGVLRMPLYKEPDAREAHRYEKGTAGDILDHKEALADDDDDEPDAPTPSARRRRRRRR